MVETIERHEMWTHSIVGDQAAGLQHHHDQQHERWFHDLCGSASRRGLGTIYMMVFNGLLIGVIGTACRQSGMSLQLWSFVAPHGVLELPAIFIAGGAGFRIAQACFSREFCRGANPSPGPDARRCNFCWARIPMLLIAGVHRSLRLPHRSRSR